MFHISCAFFQAKTRVVVPDTELVAVACQPFHNPAHVPQPGVCAMFKPSLAFKCELDVNAIAIECDATEIQPFLRRETPVETE